MKKRTLLYITIIILPLVALGFFGIRAARAEKRGWKTELMDLYRRDLLRLEKDISDELSELEEDFMSNSYLFDADAEMIRNILRYSPQFRQIFRLDADGFLDFPPAGNRSREEQAFLERTSAIWESGQRFAFPDEYGNYQANGWLRYYEADAVSFLYWIRRDDGSVLGFDVYREYILSGILVYLAADDPVIHDLNKSTDEKIILYDELGRIIFSTGALTGISVENEKAFFSMPVAEDLGGWEAKIFLSQERLSAGSGPALPFSLAALSVVLLIAAFLFWREYTREIREAGKKVSFVNQVSHELRTPLTNIRLYAELLGKETKKKRNKNKAQGRKEISEKDKKAQKYAGIICRESERLGRLINNVLTFSGKTGQVHFSFLDPFECIGNVVAMYTPRLEESSLELRYSAGKNTPPIRALFDKDILEQICWNLINNAEKYAGNGVLEIEAQLEDNVLCVDFRDNGPGIPARYAVKIFNPFFRIGNDLTEGVSGSGLGLAISRSLAEKHGGDLLLLPLPNGAWFRLTLKAGEVNENTNS